MAEAIQMGAVIIFYLWIQDNLLKASCLKSLATQEKDLSLCDNDLNNSFKAECQIAVIATLEKPVMCFDLEIDNRDQCFFSSATEMRSISLCDKIQDGIRKDQCFTQLAGMLHIAKPN